MAQKHTKRIGVYVAPETYQKVKALATQEGIGMARFMRSALRLKIKEAERGKAS